VQAPGRGPADGRPGGGLTIPDAGAAPADVERVFREEYGRAVAVLTRVFGDIDTAEDAVQDAFTEAATQWPAAGLPPSPARAVAVAELDGPAAALALVDELDLDRYYLFHAIRADLLRRLGRRAEADAAYGTAITRTGNAAERAHLALAKQHLWR
jgi:RNA polymerase sigma-70 factor, ECF subfamily